MSKLPLGWAETTVEELGEWRGGGTPSKRKPSFWTNGDIPWISPKDMKRELIDDAEDHITPAAVEESATQMIPSGSVLIVTRSGILRHTLPISVNVRDVTINQDLKALSPFEGIDVTFVANQLRAKAQDILSVCAKSGTTVDSVDFERLKAFPFRLAPLAEQRRIVVKLDTLTGATARARTELESIPALIARHKQAILSAAFTGDLTREWRDRNGISFSWRECTVKNIGQVVTGFTPPTKDKTRFFGGDIPFFKPTDLDAGYFVREPRETLTPEGANVGRRVPARSTMVTCIGATIGKTGFARVDCCTNQQINSIVPDLKKVIPEWLYWIVVSPEFQEVIITNSSATTLPIINKGRFQELPLSIPTLKEQEEIVCRIETAFGWLDRLAAEHGKAMRLLPRLDQEILAKAFRGELVPQDPTDEPASVLLERIRAERATAIKPKRSRKTPKKRLSTMSTPKAQLESQLDSWPDEGWSFEEITRLVTGDYDEIKDAVFVLLSGPNPVLAQHFEERERLMRIKKVAA